SRAAPTSCCWKPSTTRSTARPAWSASRLRSKNLGWRPRSQCRERSRRWARCSAGRISRPSTPRSRIDLLWMGLNCATGPDFMTDHLRTLSGIAKFFVACVPNAGLPDEEGHYNETPAMLAGKIARFAENGWVNLVGGCCGTTPEHIRLLVQAVAGKRPRQRSTVRRSVVSGIETLVIDNDTRPVIVGERTNVLGSRKFKRLVADGKFEEASEVGRVQVRRGAHVLDVCLQDPDRDEMADVTRFLEIEVKKVKVPLMIDSTDHRVIEESLKRTPGKSLINS